jgi:hypothetical protein
MLKDEFSKDDFSGHLSGDVIPGDIVPGSKKRCIKILFQNSYQISRCNTR